MNTPLNIGRTRPFFLPSPRRHSYQLPRKTNSETVRSIQVILATVVVFATTTPAAAETWKRHTIDNSSRGADGVRLLDVNGDGHLDITTGWEEGGLVRVYLHPGVGAVTKNWPAVTVGNVKSPEDAVLVDLDGDGAVDVVSSCEGSNKTMYVHWAPKDKHRYLVPDAWKTAEIDVTSKQQAWMFALPMPVDDRHGIAVAARPAAYQWQGLLVGVGDALGAIDSLRDSEERNAE